MKNLLLPISLFVFILAGCSKSAVDNNTQPTSMPVTNAVKTGDWMVLYYENSVSMDVGLTFLKFNSAGTVVATKDGVAYNGTWVESNTAGNNTLALNVSTTDAKLQKVNRTWKVTGISEYFIDLKDVSAAGNITAQLMKH